MKNIVVLSCGKAKLSGKHKAKDLYCGLCFKQRWKLIESLKDIDDVYIMSGKYGLIHCDDEIESYNQVLSSKYIFNENELNILKNVRLWLFVNDDYEKIFKKNNIAYESNINTLFYNNVDKKYRKLGFLYQWINLNKNRSIYDFNSNNLINLNFKIQTKRERIDNEN